MPKLNNPCPNPSCQIETDQEHVLFLKEIDNYQFFFCTSGSPCLIQVLKDGSWPFNYNLIFWDKVTSRFYNLNPISTVYYLKKLEEEFNLTLLCGL